MLPGILKAMNRGGNLDAADGFTIVEVLIVLAVSSMLFLSAVLLINGREAKTQFTTGINDEISQIQQIITDTTDGYYPNNSDFTCAGNPGGEVTPKTVAPGSTQQGTNQGCIFLGKAIQFGLGPTTPGYSTLGVLPIVGNSFQNGSVPPSPVLTLTQAVPRALYPANASAPESAVPTDTVERDYMENGLQIANGNNVCISHGLASNIAACYLSATSGSWQETGIAAFVEGDSQGNIAANASGSGSNLQSGVPQLSLYAVKGSHKDDDLMTASNALSNLGGSSSLGLDPAEEILVCISDYGGAGTSGLIALGGNGTSGSTNGGVGVTLQIKDDPQC